MDPIPSHLAPLAWYPGHLAHLVSQGFLPWHDPGDATPARADLRDADFTGADFSDADLRGANFTRANFTGANFTGADLRGADLPRAALGGANLCGADLTSADLTEARGIRFAGPVGVDGRTFYGVAHRTGPMIQAGCRWGTLAEVTAAVEADYADGTGREHLRANYLAALAWVGGVR